MPKVSQEYLDSRRQQIIDAAYRCFARKGFHQATMRDIFSEAGLSPGAVYHYFKSKEDIIEASFSFDYERSIPLFDEADANPDPVAAIDSLFEFFFAALESAAALGADRVNIQGWGEALHNPHLLTPLRESFEGLRDRLARLIRRGQASGVIDAAIDAKAAGEVILSIYLGLYLQKALVPELNVSSYKQVVTALLHGTFAKKP